MNLVSRRCLQPRLLKVRMSATPDVAEFNPVTEKFEKANQFPAYVKVDCGKCVNCLRKKALQKAARVNIETLTHPDSMVCMVTLTFAGKVPPSKVKLDVPKKDGSKFEYPRYKCVQDYHKRLRKAGLKFGFLSCEEVGDKGRGHFHEIMVIHNPELIDSLFGDDFSRFKNKFCKTRQDNLDWSYDIMCPVVTGKRQGGINITRPATNYEKKIRALLRYRFWALGKVTVSFPDNIAGVVHYCTSYATSYAAEYARNKNLPQPIYRCSRLGEDWYKHNSHRIEKGDLRVLPLGKDYSITMPRYRYQKYRSAYDRLDDFIEGYGSYMHTDFDKCYVLNTKSHVFDNPLGSERYIPKPSDVRYEDVVSCTLNNYHNCVNSFNPYAPMSARTKNALKMRVIRTNEPGDLSSLMSNQEIEKVLQSLFPNSDCVHLMDDFEFVNIYR